MEYTIKTDKENRKYHTVYGKPTRSVITWEGICMEFSGNPKLNVRLGESKFGNEFFVEFLIDKKEREYKCNYQKTHSKPGNIEIYFKIEEAFELFERLKKYFELLQNKEDKKCETQQQEK